MKTKGNWGIKSSAGRYYCGYGTFDSQIRNIQIYHWKEYAEEQIEVLKKRGYLPEGITCEVIEVVEPKERRETEAEWTVEFTEDPEAHPYCSNCKYSALNDYRGRPVDSLFCPHCGKRMINSTMPED